MGQCYGKTIPTGDNDGYPTTTITTTAASDAADLPSRTPLANGTPSGKNTPSRSSAANSPWPSPYPFGAGSAAPAGASPSPARSTPLRFFKKPFPPPSPAKHIRASLRKLGQKKKSPREGPIPEDAAAAAEDAEHQQQQQQQHALDKNFGYNKNFGAKYELGKEVGRGHFGHTCYAKGRKGELKDLPLAVKLISKAKMTSAISIEDVRR